jgi:hypothetical protein
LRRGDTAQQRKPDEFNVRVCLSSASTGHTAKSPIAVVR